MSNLSDDTLRRILEQIQQQAVASQRSLSIVNAQITSKNREKKILELTTRQLNAIPRDEQVKMYKGVGKAFIMQPRESISAEHAAQQKGITEDLSSLTKKVGIYSLNRPHAQQSLTQGLHRQSI
ncbi:hypothetical protein QFC21_000946 [Naganishia friedmannii]|uniref:Uncharacterized protein n=1 Tax=Naganishia friedmannii TaxID=89922 RepID=A0ACC2WA74_9TREE|nr:hypothetical protein QFC21_000946 [Naganishia friedmannii]